MESGYGGARPAPYLEAGVVVGDDPRVGHQFWFHPEVSKAVTTNGASFAVVTATDIELPEELRALGAILVVAPQAVAGSYAVVVRPDRYVAAVAQNENDLQFIAATLGVYA